MFLFLHEAQFTGFTDDDVDEYARPKFNMKKSFSEKLLGITFDCKLKFSNHIKNIYKKATRKLNALSRIVPYMNIPIRKILINAFLGRSLITVP